MKQDSINNLKDNIVDILDANKAEDIVAIDLKNKSDIADFMIIATGRSTKHVASTAEYIIHHLKTLDRKYIVEGMSNSDWVLIDTLDIIVHIFSKEKKRALCSRTTMAKITLCAINKITKNSPEDKIIDEYLKRIPWKVTVNQLEPKKILLQKTKNLEGTLLLESAEKNNFIVALDENGVNMSSHEFSKLIEQNSNITFLIGGAYGLSNEVKAKTNLLLSLGRITMPHILARIILIEQLYRCYTILNKHPYHK